MIDLDRDRLDFTNPCHTAIHRIIVDATGCEDWRARGLDALLGEDCGLDELDGADIAEDIEIEFHRTPEHTAALLTPAAYALRVRDVIGIADPTDPYAPKDA